MRGAKVGVSPPRRIPPCTRYDYVLQQQDGIYQIPGMQQYTLLIGEIIGQAFTATDAISWWHSGIMAYNLAASCGCPAKQTYDTT